jgi:hypothetical protein
MAIDTRSAYTELMSRTDELLAKTAARISSSPAASILDGQSKTAARMALLDEIVAETQVDAEMALTKLASARRQKIASRAERVEIVRHMARVASTLLEN